MKTFLALIFTSTVCFGESITFTNASGDVIKVQQIISADHQIILLRTDHGPMGICEDDAPALLRAQAKKHADELQNSLLTEERFSEALKAFRLNARATSKELQANLAGIEKLAHVRAGIAELEQKLAVARVEAASAFGRISDAEALNQVARLEKQFLKTAEERDRAVLARKNELSKALLDQIAQRETVVANQMRGLRPKIHEAAGAPLGSPRAKK